MQPALRPLRSEHAQHTYEREMLWEKCCPQLKRHRLNLNVEFEGSDEDDVWDQIVTGGFAVLVGPYGTGKTQLAVKLAHRACFTKGMRSAYSTAHDLFESMRKEFDDGGQGTHAGRMAMVPLLILDEIGAMTEFETKEFRRIVDRRYAAMKPSIYISNRTTDEFAKDVGPAVIDRLRECGTVIEMDGPSRRVAQ